MRCLDVVSTAAYKKSLEALSVWPEAGLIQEVLVAQARVRPKRGKPVGDRWRVIQSLPYGECPPLVLLYNIGESAITLGAIHPFELVDAPWTERDEEPVHDEFVAWLNEGNDGAVAVVAELLSRPAERWNAWIDEQRPAFTYQTLELLAQEAYDKLTKAPATSLQLADLAIGRLPNAVIPERYRHLLLILRSRLWRERANALRHTGTPAEALAAYEKAVEVLQSFPPIMSEAAAARRGAALVKHYANEPSDEPLRLVREGIATFEQTLEYGELVISHLYEGLMHFDLQRYTDAWMSFEKARDLALLLGDEPLLAHTTVNLGNCAQELKRYGDAVTHLTAAVALFDKLGMNAERPHATWGLAWIAADRGEVEHALRLFADTTAAFSRLDKPSLAADAHLDRAKVLVRNGRDAEASQSALELAEVFSKAGMLPKTAEAMQVLEAAAKGGKLTEEQIEKVRGLLQQET